MHRTPHIVCFAPYTTWSIHSARQVTILQALRLRGCSVTYITCDSVFSECDVLQPGNGAPAHKPGHACLICQSSVAAHLATWGMPYRWFGRWLTSKDFSDAAAWVGTFKGPSLADATMGEWKLGEWVASSVHKHLRHTVLDLTHPQVEAVFASYLYGGYLTAIGISRIIDEERPAFFLLFNGRMAPMRVALEIAKQRHIRTLVEERGFVPGHLTLFENQHCVDSSGVVAMWNAWKDVPLTEAELVALGNLFKERWLGQKDSVAFILGSDGADITTALKLDRSRPVWSLFTSNLDEAGGTGLAGGIFPTHEAWVRASLDFARQHNEIQLVIRVHPNSGSARSFGHNQQELALYEELAISLPENVRLVRSDEKLNSYALAAISAVGLTWHSTIGLEMAALGKPVVRSGSPDVSAQPTLLTPTSPESYKQMLANLANGHFPDPIIFARSAWRFGAAAYFRHSFPFPLVKQTGWHVAEMNFHDYGALAKGKDEMLDRICAYVIESESLHPPPPPRGEEIAAAEVDRIRRWISEARPGA